MAALTHIVLSDLHLGAKYSVLNRIVPDSGEGAPTEPSRSLVAFAEALRTTVRMLPTDEKPKLVLLGDVLEMAFADRSMIAMGFQRFIECIFPPDEDPVFSDEIIVVPGNHDHYLWNSEVDRHYLDQIPDDTAGRLPEAIKVTQAFGKPRLESTLLTGLINRYKHLKKAKVVIAYPNLGLVGDDGQRCVILHHGHYVEPLYRLMTLAASWIDGRTTDDVSVEQLEQENGSWVDFLWSSLGTAGGISSNLLQLYEVMQDTAAMHVATRHLTNRILHQYQNVLPMTGLPDVRTLAKRLIKTMLNASLGRASQMERAAYDRYLTEESLNGLRWYLEYPLHHQMCRELTGRMGAQSPEDLVRTIPQEMTFIFGHTHKPFEEMIPLDEEKYPMPAKILNTGGWVLDQPRQATTQGASTIFVDDDCNVAALRLFNNTVSGEVSRVSVRHVVGSTESNPLEVALTTAIREIEGHDGEERDGPWQKFSTQVHDSLYIRGELMSKIFFDPAAGPSIPKRILP